MGKFRKRPVVIEAIWLNPDPTPEEAEAVHAFLGDITWESDRHGIIIRTLEGDMLAEDGDWLIRGVKGEVYPCKPDIFDLTYEAVPDA